MRKRYFIGFLLWGLAWQSQAVEQEALFAGGCFWCMEEAFEQVPGVTEVISGFSGGDEENPSYKEVVGGATGHYETVLVRYDEQRVNYVRLLQIFWRNIDPLDEGGQFCDRGSSYRAAVFYLNEEQKKQAQKSKGDIIRQYAFSAPVVTPLIPAGSFYPATEDHQDYARRNPIRYKYYKYSCRRPQRLNELWGEPQKEERPLY